MKNRKIFSSPFEIRALEESGTFEGYASVFDDADHSKDKVAPGAFADTLAEHKMNNRLPPMLWQHDTKEPIGAWREMFEDKRGLYVRGELFIDDIPKARQAHKLLRENVVTGLSIGFRTVTSAFNPKTGERTLTKIDLLEVSMVTFPALESARVSSVKTMMAKGDIPDKREFEVFLRDAGFSRKQAKGLIADGYSGLLRRDAVSAQGGEDEDTRAIMALSDLLKELSSFG